MAIENDRIEPQKTEQAAAGRYVLYWMQQSQRGRCNHALEYAASRANSLGMPLLVCLVVIPSFPDATETHYRFMLAGLPELAEELAARGIGFVVRCGEPLREVLSLAAEAAVLVLDRGYLRPQRRWREGVRRAASCPVVEVESDVVVPVGLASDRDEYSAATFRRRISPQVESRLQAPKVETLRLQATGLTPAGLEPRDSDAILRRLGIPSGAPSRSRFQGGSRAAQTLLSSFIAGKLARYDQDRSDPSLAGTSDLSPYLHFGHISPLDVALQVRASTEAPQAALAAFFDELIVRRELAINFVHYCPDYDSYTGIPAWARDALARHRADPRPYRYSSDQLDAAATQDPFWNAAQTEMRTRGKMHGYMRMYWGKKLIEWSAAPEEAYALALQMNNRYELDGRDANGYAGVAWCFGKHDRPWAPRPIFGTVRYMNANGLRRKFDIDAYVCSVNAL